MERPSTTGPIGDKTPMILKRAGGLISKAGCTTFASLSFLQLVAIRYESCEITALRSNAALHRMGAELSPTQPAPDVFIYYLCRPTPPSNCTV